MQPSQLFAQSSSMPKRCMKRANSPKHAIVMMLLQISVAQNPRRGSSSGNTKNMGRVGTTYQKVYQACFEIFSCPLMLQMEPDQRQHGHERKCGEQSTSLSPAWLVRKAIPPSRRSGHIW